MTVKEKLEEALAAKDNNIKSFVWKGEREEVMEKEFSQNIVWLIVLKNN